VANGPLQQSMPPWLKPLVTLLAGGVFNSELLLMDAIYRWPLFICGAISRPLSLKQSAFFMNTTSISSCSTHTHSWFLQAVLTSEMLRKQGPRKQANSRLKSVNQNPNHGKQKRFDFKKLRHTLTVSSFAWQLAVLLFPFIVDS